MSTAGISVQEESTQKWASTIAFMALQTTNYNETLAQVPLSQHPTLHELCESSIMCTCQAICFAGAPKAISYASMGRNTTECPSHALPP